MTEVTTEWMKFMIEKAFPPLTPHHTQAFIVMMMSRFFADHLDPETAAERKKSKKGAQLKAFVAQMSTGEGKSIVIAMCAIFMVKLYGLKVHVLENNEGLLERDYATNAPFYAKFGIKSGKDLSEEGVQICYTLKSAINKHFLRGMVSGSLELNSTVLIVDEVDDLIVNERPNAHYVKVDVENTPALVRALAALKTEQPKPDDVADDIWQRASRDWAHANEKVKDVDYRVVLNAEGKEQLVMLDKEGRVPKVALTAPWLKALAYKLCGEEPTSDSHFACVCTPYVFNSTRRARACPHRRSFCLAPLIMRPRHLVLPSVCWYLRVDWFCWRQGGAWLPHKDVQGRQVRRAALSRHVRGVWTQDCTQSRCGAARRPGEASAARRRARAQVLSRRAGAHHRCIL